MPIKRTLLFRLLGAGLGLLIALWFVRDWLLDAPSFLIALNLIIAGCGAYAGWQLAALIEMIIGPRAQPTSSTRLGGMAEAPPLSKSRATKVRQIVAALAGENVFAPAVPRVEALFGPIADRDEPPDQEVVLTALWEADCYEASFVLDQHLANLAFHDSKMEQGEDTVAGQLADLARLCGEDLRISDVSIHHPLVNGPGPQPQCTIAFEADDRRIELSYRPASKYTSTVLHVAIAQALTASNAGRRLAWLWNDQGAWISALRAGGVERLNAAAGRVRGGFGGWDWIDQSPPFAAGET